MNVGELQKQLSKLNPDLEVLCYYEDKSLQNAKQAFRLFDIESTSATNGEKVRLEDNTPYLKLGQSSKSEVVVLLTINPDF